MQLGAKRAVDARATLLLGRAQNAHEARPRPSFRGQKAVSHVVWTQIPSTVLPPGQMAKCENCDSVHWQRQQSSVQVREPETGVEKVKRKWLQRTGPQVYPFKPSGHTSWAQGRGTSLAKTATRHFFSNAQGSLLSPAANPSCFNSQSLCLLSLLGLCTTVCQH